MATVKQMASSYAVTSEDRRKYPYDDFSLGIHKDNFIKDATAFCRSVAKALKEIDPNWITKVVVNRGGVAVGGEVYLHARYMGDHDGLLLEVGTSVMRGIGSIREDDGVFFRATYRSYLNPPDLNPKKWRGERYRESGNHWFDTSMDSKKTADALLELVRINTATLCRRIYSPSPSSESVTMG